MPLDLNITQTVVLAVAAALIVVPRLGAVKEKLVAWLAWLRPSTNNNDADIHAKVDAYRTLAGDLPAELAREVWACMQTPGGGGRES